MVPRNPQNPSTALIGMAIDRRPASGAKIGSLLVNPGGPGVSGVDSLPGLISTMPKAVLDRFDVVGFDPPGVGRTAPIRCLDSGDLERYFHTDPSPVTQAGVQELLASDRTFAAGCEARSGAELPYVSTADAAIDLDFIRQALGDAKLTYLGFSYGTLLGATYAALFPTKVRAMVLDGPLDPAVPSITGLDEQAVGLDGQLRQFFASCTANSKCAWKPTGDPETAFRMLIDKVRSSPLPVKGTSRTVGPAELLFGTAITLYSTNSWIDLQFALSDASAGDGTDFLQLFDDYTGRQADGSYDNLFEANAAINCVDAPAPTMAQVDAALPAAQAQAPVFGPQNLYGAESCDGWPVAPTGKPGAIHAPGAPTIVVVGSTGDPITPYRWAQGLASELGNAVLLTRVGDGHTGYRSSTCIRRAVDAYLIGLTSPPAGQRCPSS